MQYVFDGEFYTVAKITGPRHNMLALAFCKIDQGVEVIDLKKSDDEVVNFLPDEIERQVLIGLKEINKELGTNYSVNKIEFISSDSLSNVIYTELTKQIVGRLQSGEEFKRI